MNENLNLVEILKDCPKGTKFYSILHGEVKYMGIKDKEDTYKIKFELEDGDICGVTPDGRYYSYFNGECILFPSKDQRDWSKFTAPWYKKESDDDIIKTAILNHLKKMWVNCQDDVCGVHTQDAINWLEKQGEDKKEINNFDVRPGLYKCVHRIFDGTPDGRLLFERGGVYKCLSKHNMAEFEISYGHSVYLEDSVVCKYFIPFEDKDEPKFKVGDWVVYDNNSVYQVKEIEYIIDATPRYELKNIDGDKLSIPSTLNYILRSWTIEDAKDGDVIHLGTVTAIFKKYIGREKCICYCSFCKDGGFEIPIENGEDNVYGCYNTTPATKEQRDLLFKKMKEAGYEWDAEEKELRRIK